MGDGIKSQSSNRRVSPLTWWLCSCLCEPYSAVQRRLTAAAPHRLCEKHNKIWHSKNHKSSFNYSNHRAVNLWKLTGTSVTICYDFKIFSNISQNFSIFTWSLWKNSRKFQYFEPKLKKRFLTQGLISLTKYWNSVTVGSPVIMKTSRFCQIEDVCEPNFGDIKHGYT